MGPSNYAELLQSQIKIKEIKKKVFKSGSSKICERQPLKTLKANGLLKQTISLEIFKGRFPQILVGPLLNTLSHLNFLSFANVSRDQMKDTIALSYYYHCTKN